MGLDMYLYGRKFHWTDWKDEKNNSHVDGFRVSETVLSLGYWRKHPNLHGYIVQEFGYGVDECQRIELDENDLLKIVEAVEEDKLPHTEGFFFGESRGANDQDTVAQLLRALAWLKTPDTRHSRAVVYQASW